MENIIVAQNVTKTFSYRVDRPTSVKRMLIDLFRGRWNAGEKIEYCALEDVTFEIKEGEFVGIMGRNGAGKSTLMKLISGIYSPTSGSLNVHSNIAPLIELGAGFHPDLSGYENIFLNSAVLGFGRKATLAAVDDILSFAELGEHIYKPVKTYSSGMVIRLGFSIACNMTAPILLIDEVLAVGDAGFQAKCYRKISELHQQGRTVVLITHDSPSVLKYCQRCIVIDNKKKIYDGPVAEGVSLYLQTVGV